MWAYIWVFPHEVAESSKESQAHASVLVQDPTHSDKQSQSLADHIITIFQKPWIKTKHWFQYMKDLIHRCHI